MSQHFIRSEAEVIRLLRCFNEMYTRLIAPEKRRALARQMTPEDRAILKRLATTTLKMCSAGQTVDAAVQRLRPTLPPEWQ